MKKTLTILLALVLVLGCFAGCGDKAEPAKTEAGTSAPASDSGKKDSGKTDSGKADSGAAAGSEAAAPAITDLRVGLPGEPTTLDLSIVALNALNASVTTSIYAMLFDYNSETGEYYNYMATDHEWVDDVTLHVTIRDDVYSQSGAHITADDVVFDFTRGQANPAMSTTYQWFVPGSFKTVDEYTFEVKYTTPMPNAWTTFGLATTGIYAQSDFESMSEDEWARAPIGTGPYKVDHWDAGNEIVLTKVENFWGDESPFNSITFKFIPDANARILALQSHDIDYTENIGASLAPTASSIEGVELFNSDIGETQMIWFNGVNNPITTNSTVRKALEYATNKEAVLYTIYNGNGAVNDSVFTKASPQYRAPAAAEDRAYNVEKAKELLAEAGYPNGFDLHLLCYESVDYQNILTIIQSQWAEVGVNCIIDTMDKGAFFEKVYGGDFDCYTIHNLGLDPTTRLFNFRSTLTVADGNLTGFANPDYDAALDKAVAATSMAERDEYCMECADYIREGCPFFPVCDSYLISAGDAHLGNVQNGPTSYITYYKMIVD